MSRALRLRTNRALVKIVRDECVEPAGERAPDEMGTCRETPIPDTYETGDVATAVPKWPGRISSTCALSLAERNAS